MRFIPRHVKNDQEMGRVKFLESFIIGFYEFYDYQY